MEGKQNAELISPAVYEAGAKRRNQNVLAWAGWCAVDIDDWDFEETDYDIIEQILENRNQKYIVSFVDNDNGGYFEIFEIKEVKNNE